VSRSPAGEKLKYYPSVEGRPLRPVREVGEPALTRIRLDPLTFFPRRRLRAEVEIGRAGLGTSFSSTSDRNAALF
jgi:hypothetical protein